MKLGSLKEGGRDGTLIVVSRDLRHGVRATGIAATLQQALEDWSHIAPRLNERVGGICAVVIGTGAAMVWDSELYIHFLHLIGAIFAPLSAILFTVYFLMRRDDRHRTVSVPSIVSLAAGVGGHVLFSKIGSPVGPTFSCLLLTLAVHVCLRAFLPVKRGSAPGA